MSGCGTALRVSHRATGTTANPISVPGVPFYIKKARCRQEIVWFEPIYTLTLSASLPDKDGTLQNHPRGSVVLSLKNFKSPEVNDFMKLLNNSPTDEGTVLREWRKVVARADSQVLARDFASLKADERILAGRSAAPAPYVDYSEQYYVNAKLPIAGSANVDAKVADDGSLSEASAQVETKTLETVLSALPIGNVITGALGMGGKALAATGEVESFQLTISVSGYLHTLSRFADYPKTDLTCPVAEDISLAEAMEYKREDISAAARGKQDKSADASPKKASTSDGSKKKIAQSESTQ